MMRIYLFIITLLFGIPALQAATLEQQRDWFQQARHALNQQQIKQFKHLKNKLKDYPLTPYLDIWYASKQLKKGDDSLVSTALLAYADVPEAIDLRRSWFKYLAKKGEWAEVQHLIDVSPKLASKFPEKAMVIAWNLGNKEASIEQFTQRWVQGKAFSRQANDLYHAWQKLDHPSEVERWQRMGIFARKRQWTKVHRLERSLSSEKKAWLAYWKRLQKHPEKALDDWPQALLNDKAVMLATGMVKDVIKRLSRRDVEKAWEALHKLEAEGIFQEKLQELALLERRIALRAARQHKPIALTWLEQLPRSVQNEDTHGWQVRLAALAHDWPTVLKATHALSVMRQDKPLQDRWLYWQAQAWDKLGESQRAKNQLAVLAKGRGYYNFLSADFLGEPFHLEASHPHVSNELLAEIKAMPAISRVSEWRALGKFSKASREWHFALADTDQAHWKAALVLASRWQWDNQTIRAAFKANELDALVFRFPLSYKKIVMQASRRSGLTPAMIWSVIRQESAFNQHAVSHAGAKGLMQLMPATARHVARKLKLGKGTPQLFSAATNIRLGASYLAEVKQRFGNEALAAAGYNAGPHRVATWLERMSFQSPEAWIEAIPFDETRRYVQQVMAFVAVYEWRQDKQPSSLLARLHSRTQEVSFNPPVLPPLL